MHLLLVRHAIAADLGGPIRSDEDRPLTAAGRRRFAKVAAGLARIQPRPDAILTSPLLRARQTGDLIASVWGDLQPRIEPVLAGGAIPSVLGLLASFDDKDTIVLVGHETWMSEFTAHLVGAKSGVPFRYRKGGVALVEVERPEAGGGRLAWFIPPRVFRKI